MKDQLKGQGMDDETAEAYQEVVNAFYVALNEGQSTLDWQPREDGKIEITVEGTEFVLILKRKD